VYPSTVEVVRDFIARQTESHIGSTEPGVKGQVAPYDKSVAQLGFQIHQSTEDFKAIDEQFKAADDGSARRYWDDPEFAEQQRKEIAKGKARKH